MMSWEQRLQLLRWRAIEEADGSATLLPAAQREDATRHAVDAGGDFHAQRTEWLRLHAAVPGSPLHETLESLQPHRAGVFAALGLIAALMLGYALTELGHEHLINVVALPFMGLLLWNAFVIVISLVMEWQSSSTKHGIPLWVVHRLLPKAPVGDALDAKIARRFRALAGTCLALRVSTQARAWLHIAAATLALGTMTGMYAKGWSHEYRAVWESTLLSQSSAERFLSALYKPASVVFGIHVPVEQLATMRDGPGRMPQPADALPWIHLFAGTLVLLVLLPRLALAALTLWRGAGRVRQCWDTLDWPLHEARLRSAISGSGLEIDVIMHGWRQGEEPRNRWSNALREHFGALALLQFHACGDEEDFIVRWQSQASTIVVVFNAATTPEQEVHATFMRDLRTQLMNEGSTAQLAVLLDATTLRDRRTEEAVTTRLDLWRTLLRGTCDAVMVA